jgi:hypothetical protein
MLIKGDVSVAVAIRFWGVRWWKYLWSDSNPDLNLFDDFGHFNVFGCGYGNS